MRSQYQVPFDDPSADGQPSWSGQYTADGGSHGTDTPDRGQHPHRPGFRTADRLRISP